MNLPFAALPKYPTPLATFNPGINPTINWDIPSTNPPTVLLLSPRGFNVTSTPGRTLAALSKASKAPLIGASATSPTVSSKVKPSSVSCCPSCI